MSKFLTPRNLVLGLILIVLAGFAFNNLYTHGKFSSSKPSVALPEKLSTKAIAGKRYFDENCAACHGKNAAGNTGNAPPLVHIIYEPSHHGDVAFYRAVTNGVRAHHWKFGNMPPIENLTEIQVSYIIAYVRELQRANGIN